MLRPQFEVLPGLPSYGPMYISVTENDTPYFSEGYVLRIFKTDGSSWVANFEPGWSSFSRAYDYPDKQSIIVIAGGLGYVMFPNEEKPQLTFGRNITEALQLPNGTLVCANNVDLIIIDNTNGQLWQTEGISWDGIKNLSVIGDEIHGLAFDPAEVEDTWRPFSVNLVTREIDGGTNRESSRNWWKFWA